MRVLITISPRMYRESVALALQTHRPELEVMMGSVQSLDGDAQDFRPHLFIRNDTDGANMARMDDILCWIEILYSDSMGARISMGGEVWNIEDMSTEDLLEIIDRTREMIPTP